MQKSDSHPDSTRPQHPIELRLESRVQLFEVPSPSPLGLWVLNSQISEYIAEHAKAIGKDVPIKLKVHLLANEMVDAADIPGAIRAHFESCYNQQRKTLGRVLYDGRVTLAVGMVFLILVNGLAEPIRAAFERRFLIGVANGLEIFGWVAMWRPAELLLYDWIPVRRQMKLMSRLVVMEIECQARP